MEYPLTWKWFLYLKLFRQITCYRPQRSCGKVMFSQASVILFTEEGVYPSMHLGSPPEQTPPVQTPPRADTPQADTPPQCILGYTPPCPVHVGIHTLLPSACWDTCPPAGHCSRRYASYWNAFLFKRAIAIQILKILIINVQIQWVLIVQIK